MSKRMRYFCSHLAVSFLLAALTAVLVTQVWYPAPLFKATGLAKIFFMLLAIDVLIGPLFSLLVYKEGKKTLKFDLAVVALIQFGAFAYGFYSIAEGRPAWVVFNQDRFELVRLNEIDDRDIEKALPEYQSVSLGKPQWVSVDLNHQSAEAQHKVMLEESLSGGMYSVAQSPVFYQSINMEKVIGSNKIRPLVELEKYNTKDEVQAVLANFSQVDGFFPLKSVNYDMVVLVGRKENQTWQQIVDLRPW